MILKKKSFSFVLIFIFFTQSVRMNGVQIVDSQDRTSLITLIKSYLPENPVIVDAGAFDGADSVLMSQLIPGSTIHAFEPDPENYIALQKKIKNVDNILCYSTALSDTTGIVQFHRSENVHFSVDHGSGSLLAPKEHLVQFPHILFKEVIDVFATTLDIWASTHKIKQIDLLWLDLQGMELTVLKAAPHMLKNVKVVYTEVEFIEQYAGQCLYNDVRTWLENQGFIMVAKDFDVPGSSSYTSMGNILMVRN